MKTFCLVLPLSLTSISATCAEVTLNFFNQAGSFLTAPYYESGVRMTSLAGHYDFGTGLNIDPIVEDSTALTDSRVRFDMYGAWFDPGKIKVSSPGGFLTSSKGGVLSLSSAGTYAPSGEKWKNVEWVDFSVKAPTSPNAELPFSQIDSISLGFEQGVYLDFGSAPSRGIKATKTVTKAGSKTQYSWSTEATALGRQAATFTPAQIDSITGNIRNIFNKSGAPVPVFAKTSEFADAWYDLPTSGLVKVKFGSAVPGLLGKASAVDQFNRSKEDEVGVFVGPSNANIATVAAHEVGHVLGVRHVNPKTTADEVEDYALGSSEQFTAVATAVREKPVNSNLKDLKFNDGTAITHNPVYHIKKYSLGETEGLGTAGTYDTRELKSYKASFEIELTNDFDVDNFLIVEHDGGEFSSESFGEIFDGAANGKTTLVWQGLEGSEFEIFGRKSGSEDYEIALFSGDSTVFGFDQVPTDLTLQLYDVETNSYRTVGAAVASIALAPAVPEGDAALLALAGLCTVLSSQFRRAKPSAPA